jgi:hypothetical protein
VSGDLIAWLTAIWDEQERAARLEKQLADDFFGGDDFTVEYQWARMTKHTNGAYGSSFSKGAPSPTEVLARSAAERQILALHREVGSAVFGGPTVERWRYCETCQRADEDAEMVWPCETIRLLASMHADRPGYREEWKL